MFINIDANTAIVAKHHSTKNRAQRAPVPFENLKPPMIILIRRNVYVIITLSILC